AGRPGEAIDHAYAALLRRLESDGLVRVEKWRTNGDYLRDLRQKPDLRQKVAGIVRDVEILQFGDNPPSHEHFDGLFARILPLVQGALLFVVMMLMSACGAQRGPEPDSPSGMSGVLELLKKTGVPLELMRRPGIVQIVDEMTGQSSPNPFASLARAGLGLLLLQMAFLMALWFWHRGRAFGSRREPPPPQRRAFVEHVRAVGAQYAK